MLCILKREFIAVAGKITENLLRSKFLVEKRKISLPFSKCISVRYLRHTSSNYKNKT